MTEPASSPEADVPSNAASASAQAAPLSQPPLIELEPVDEPTQGAQRIPAKNPRNAEASALSEVLLSADSPNGSAPEEPLPLEAAEEQPAGAIIDAAAGAVCTGEAVGSILMLPETQLTVLKSVGTHADMLASARVAGILAGKRTGELVPACPARAVITCEVGIRPIAATKEEVLNGWMGPREDGRAGFLVQATCSGTSATDARTEALHAVLTASLTLFDQLKGIDTTLEVSEARVVMQDAEETPAEAAPEPEQDSKPYVSPLPGGSSAGASAPAVAFIGFQNAGKTTLVERVIAKLSNRGLRVGSIKLHGPKGFDIDQPGKDSWRHAQAGSRHVGLISPDQYAEYASTEQEVPVADLLTHFTDVDIVIVEGYKTTGIPSIVVARSGVDRIRGTNSYDLIDQDTLAIACNDVTARGFRAHWTKMMENAAEDEDANTLPLPTFLDINDIPEIVSFIVDKLALGKK